MADLESAPKEMEVDFDRIGQPCSRFDRVDQVPGPVCDQLHAADGLGDAQHAADGVVPLTGTIRSTGCRVVAHLPHRARQSVCIGRIRPYESPSDRRGDRRPWCSPVASAIIDGMNSPGDMDGTGSDDRDPDDGPAVVDEERTVVGAGLPGDEDDDVPVPLDVDVEVPTADAIDQHRDVTLDDDDYDQV